MKIIQMLIKDLKLFIRDGKTVALVAITPIIIMSILALIFSSTGAAESITGISLGICNLDSQKHPELNNLPMFDVQTLSIKNCENNAQVQVQQGKLRGALIIPKDFTSDIEQGKGTQLTLYVDGAKSQTAIVTIDSIKALTQDLNQEIGTQFINQAWVQLNELNTKLKIAVKEINKAKAITTSAEQNITDYIEQVEKLNIEEIKTKVNEINSSEITLQPTITLLTTAISNLQSGYTALCTTPEIGCTELQTAINQLQGLQTTLIIQEAQLNSTLSESQNTTAAIIEGITNTEILRNETLNKLITLRQQLQDYRTEIETTTNELEQTTKVLDEYTTRDPINIIRAVNLDTERYYGDRRYVENLTPGLIGILLLFITLLITSSNIIVEQKSGTLTRNLLSPTKLSTFLNGKIAYLLVIGIIQSLIIIATLFFFSIHIPLTLALGVTILTTIFSFITLGLFIGSFSKTENTALLTCLVFSIPMMFLAGVFFPFEVMPSFIQTIAQHLPLTLGIINLEKVLIYSTAIDTTKILETIAISVILLFIAHQQIKRKASGN